MALAPSMRLGPYEIVAAIGAGGMGEVYRARDPRLARFVAVKILPAYLSHDADRLRRFEQEARATGLLNHPNILAIYDLGTSEGTPFIVSELLEGETLRTRLGSGPLPVRKAIEYSIQISNGLAAAHSKGIVHRDLKPENLFITSDGRVKILDFGLAKLMESDDQPAGGNSATLASQTEPGMIMGTVGYMSPEQLRGLVADARSDIFALGAILYEMLSGQRAFRGETPADTISAILKEDPPELTAAARNIPLGLERIVRHCLEKNPAERFQSARDLAFNLEALTAPSGVSAGVPVALTRRPKWRIPIMAAVVLLVMATAAFLLGRLTGTRTTPRFEQVTFRSGTVHRARFAHDGQSVLYSAAWEGKPAELFAARVGSVESRSIDRNMIIAAISSHDEAAVLLDPTINAYGSVIMAEGTLAVRPVDGGAARPLVEHVQWADWSPDGSELAIIKPSSEPTPGAQNVLQFPPDRTIYAPASGWISDVRFSPDGKYLAIAEHIAGGDDGKLVIISINGHKIAESPLYNSINSLAWAPGGEVWYTANLSSSGREVESMDRHGHTREVYRAPGDLTLHDIAADGRVLLTNDNSRMLVLYGHNGQQDTNLSWLNWSLAADISRDGSTLLFSESSSAVAGSTIAFTRKTDGSPAVMLGNELPLRLSPDGKWIAARDESMPKADLVLLPTGAGTPEKLALNGWDFGGAGVVWAPDGRSLLVTAAPPGQKYGVYSVNVATKQIKFVLPAGVVGGWPSPDNQFIAGLDGNTPKIYTRSGRLLRTLPALPNSDVIDKWTADGKSLLVWKRYGVPRLERMDAITGQRTLMTEIRPPDVTGAVNFLFFRATPDAKAYTYSEYRLLNDLFVVSGLR